MHRFMVRVLCTALFVSFGAACGESGSGPARTLGSGGAFDDTTLAGQTGVDDAHWAPGVESPEVTDEQDPPNKIPPGAITSDRPYVVWGDDRFVYVGKQDGLDSYSVDSGGGMSLLDSDSTVTNIGDLWRDGDFLYVSANDGLHTFSVDSSGNLTDLDTWTSSYGNPSGFDTPGAIWGDGNFIYVCFAYSGLHTFSADGSGKLTHIGNYDAYDAFPLSGWDWARGARDVWGDGNFIYCVFNKEGIKSFSVDGSGNLTPKSALPYINVVAGSALAEAYTIWSDGTFVYVSGYYALLLAHLPGEVNTVHYGIFTYSVDKGGILSLVGSYPLTITDPVTGVTVPGTNVRGPVWGDGNFIYMSAHRFGLFSFSADGSGDLTLEDHDDQGFGYYPDHSAANAWKGSFSTGEFLFLTDPNNNMVHAYSVDSGGTLTSLTMATP